MSIHKIGENFYLNTVIPTTECKIKMFNRSRRYIHQKIKLTYRGFYSRKFWCSSGLMSKTMVNSCCSTFSLLCNTRLSMSPILRRVCSSISLTWSPLDPKYCKGGREKENGSLVTNNYIAICSQSMQQQLQFKSLSSILSSL